MKRKINIIEDIDGKKTVFIHDIIFKGKKNINWDVIYDKKKHCLLNLRIPSYGPGVSGNLSYNLCTQYNALSFMGMHVEDSIDIEENFLEIAYMDLPDEYTHSKYTRILKGANAKAKANVVQGLPELLQIASNEIYEENRKEKHIKNAKYGWYSYDARFAFPVCGDYEEIERYNVFNVALLVRHDADGKHYLYDIMKIKKETSTLF